MSALLMSMLSSLVVVGSVLLVLWGLSLHRKDASIIDIFWGPAFAIVAWTTAMGVTTLSARGVLVTVMASLWGLRLGAYLGWRNHGKAEDYRYQAMRRSYGSRFTMISLPLVFGVQGALILVISLPVQVAINASGPSLTVLDAIGLAVWAVGLCFESLGDWQLAAFKADPRNRGRVMNKGLWRYTRHPNYFGDFMVWWGFFLMAVSTPWGLLTALGPAVMTFMLLRVSGVALLERTISERRPDYADYIARTSPFFPMPPRPARR